MKPYWAEQFLKLAESQGVVCKPIRYAKGWLETALIAGHRCFTKSMTYNFSRREYFQGVDPKKLRDTGDAVLLCGGAEDRLRDVFVISWDTFFATIGQSEPIKSYKVREYLQYKFHIRDRGNTWKIYIQRGPVLDVTAWRYEPSAAIQALVKMLQ